MHLCAGGSWVSGSASLPQYDADADIALVEDVIVVTANYRLNIYGFLAAEALRSDVRTVH